MQRGGHNFKAMTYLIKTWHNGLLLGQITARATDLINAEREAVHLVTIICKEKVDDVFYPPGESRIESHQKINGETMHFVRTVSPLA